MKIKDKRFKRIWRFFCSIRLALVLLSLIILASIIGTIVSQGLLPDEYIKRYGRTPYNLFSVFGFFDIYHSWWFVILLSLFFVNLLICSIDRLRFSLQTVGSIFTHLSIILILLGALISALFGQRGFMDLYEGESKDIFYVKDKPYKLDFKVSLEDFDIQWYKPQSHQVIVYVKNKNKKQVYSVELGKVYQVKGTNYSFIAVDYIPDFFIRSDGTAKSKSEWPRNPTLLVKIRHLNDVEERWVFANFPNFVSIKDENIKFIYNWSGRIKDFQSKVKISQADKAVLTKIIRVNCPLKYKGYTFYQSNYNPEELTWTGLQVVKDPGVGWVFFGFILLNGGLLLTYYVRLKKRR